MNANILSPSHLPKGSAVNVLASIVGLTGTTIIEIKISKKQTLVLRYVMFLPLVNETCEDFCVDCVEFCALFLQTSFVVFQLISSRRPRLGNKTLPGNDESELFSEYLPEVFAVVVCGFQTAKCIEN